MLKIHMYADHVFFFFIVVKYNLLAVQKYGYFSSHTKAGEGEIPLLGDVGVPVHVHWLMT